MRETPPFDRGIVAEEMVGRGRYPAEIDIVKPGPERRDLAPELVAASGSASASSRPELQRRDATRLRRLRRLGEEPHRLAIAAERADIDIGGAGRHRDRLAALARARR